MNWIDFIIIIALILHGIHGYRRGFVSLFFELMGFVISIGVGLMLLQPIGRLLDETLPVTEAVSRALGFLLPFFISYWIYLTIVFKLRRRIPEQVIRSDWNRISGVFPALVEGVILIGLLLVLIISLPVEEVPRDAITKSCIGRELVDAGAVVQSKAVDIFGGAVRDLFTFKTVEPGSKERLKLAFHTTDYTFDSQSENRMLRLINQERTKRGLKPLKMDVRLRAIARAYSAEMLRKGFFGHIAPDEKSPFDRMGDVGIKYTSAGENLALAPNVEIAHTGLMQSPGHRANILNPSYGRIGIGAAKALPYGIMFTQEFTN